MTIFDSSQANEGEKIGIQFSGNASEIKSIDKVRWMVNLWKKLISGEKGYRPEPQDLLKIGNSRVYKVAPKRIKFYNSKAFPKDKFKVVDF